jgi:hypothetical protein
MNFSKNSGKLLIATGVFHNVIGFVAGWRVLVEIVRSGFINSINGQMDRNFIFWFLFGGFMMIIMGKLMQDYLETDWQLPKWLGISLLVLSIIGCVMMPVSGFWLVIPQAILILIPGRKRRELLV